MAPIGCLNIFSRGIFMFYLKFTIVSLAYQIKHDISIAVFIAYDLLSDLAESNQTQKGSWGSKNINVIEAPNRKR